jgi:hypothetical protein
MGDPTQSTTPDHYEPGQIFRITHPFHPLCGQEFKLVRAGHSWRDQRVWFYNEADELISLPRPWTNLWPLDPFVVVSKERAYARVEDLLRLAQYVRDWRGATVKENKCKT